MLCWPEGFQGASIGRETPVSRTNRRLIVVVLHSLELTFVTADILFICLAHITHIREWRILQALSCTVCSVIILIENSAGIIIVQWEIEI